MPTFASCRKPSAGMKVFGPRTHFLGEKSSGFSLGPNASD